MLAKNMMSKYRRHNGRNESNRTVVVFFFFWFFTFFLSYERVRCAGEVMGDSDLEVSLLLRGLQPIIVNSSYWSISVRKQQESREDQ